MSLLINETLMMSKVIVLLTLLLNIFQGHTDHHVESLQRYYKNNKAEFDTLVEQSIAAAKKLQKAINLIDLELISLSENKTTANVEISEWRKGIERVCVIKCHFFINLFSLPLTMLFSCLWFLQISHHFFYTNQFVLSNSLLMFVVMELIRK